MAIEQIIYSILGPAWLKSQIALIALLLSGCFLAYFGGFVHGKIIFPIADTLRQKTEGKLNQTKAAAFSRFIARSLAAIIFILYVWLGVFLVAEYFFEPILNRLRNFILIWVILLFLLVSYAINNTSLRRQIMGH